MYDGELPASQFVEATADADRRARTGYEFMASEFPNWDRDVPVDDIYSGHSDFCALAWAGKPQGLDFYGVVDRLRMKYPDMVTNEWLYDHAFIDGSWLKHEAGNFAPGYALTTDSWRAVVREGKPFN